MGQTCNDGSCAPKESCGSGCGCKGSSCGSSGSGCEMTDMMKELADCAWADLMKEKMKAELQRVRGEKMDKVAAAGVKSSIDYWEHKMAGKMKCHEAKENMKQAFMG